MAPAKVAPRTRATETAARRQRLLQAATALAGEGGYDAVQMRDVAARAEVALGTLYRHYSSKDQLLLAALAAQADELERRLAGRPPEGGCAAERVADVLRRANRAIAREPRVMSAMVTALSSPDAAAAGAKQDVYDALTAIIAGAIGGQQVAELDRVVRVLGHVWFSALAFWVGDLLTVPQMTDELETAARLLLGSR